jgi:hypothetical protein
MSWLQESIDHFLTLNSQDNPKKHNFAYNDCLWRIVTASKADLSEVITKLWDDPYYFLPPPLAVAMCRLYVLESKELTPDVTYAISYISAHCDPEEEKGATSGFAHWLPST